MPGTGGEGETQVSVESHCVIQDAALPLHLELMESVV